jgi:hypothetical protein
MKPFFPLLLISVAALGAGCSANPNSQNSLTASQTSTVAMAPTEETASTTAPSVTTSTTAVTQEDTYTWDGLSFRLPKEIYLQNSPHPDNSFFEAVTVPGGLNICHAPPLAASNHDCKEGFYVEFFPYQKSFFDMSGDGPEPLLKKTQYPGIYEAYPCSSSSTCNPVTAGMITYQIQFGHTKWYVEYMSSYVPYEKDTHLADLLSSIRPLAATDSTTSQAQD